MSALNLHMAHLFVEIILPVSYSPTPVIFFRIPFRVRTVPFYASRARILSAWKFRSILSLILRTLTSFLYTYSDFSKFMNSKAF